MHQTSDLSTSLILAENSANAAPQRLDADVTFAENGTGTAPEGTPLSWSLSGTDAGLFNLDTATGVATFKAAPNFEAPANSVASNIYDITDTASNGTLSSAPSAVAITATNVNEAVKLMGGLGADTLNGGTGPDVFRYGLTTKSGDAFSGYSVVDDVMHFSATRFGGGLVEAWISSQPAVMRRT